MPYSSQRTVRLIQSNARRSSTAGCSSFPPRAQRRHSTTRSPTPRASTTVSTMRLRSPLARAFRWATPGLCSAHICAGTGAHPCHICAGTGAHPCHICAGTGLAPATPALGMGPTAATSALGLGSPLPTSAPQQGPPLPPLGVCSACVALHLPAPHTGTQRTSTTPSRSSRPSRRRC
jgi:hypothetical protein